MTWQWVTLISVLWASTLWAVIMSARNDADNRRTEYATKALEARKEERSTNVTSIHQHWTPPGPS